MRTVPRLCEVCPSICTEKPQSGLPKNEKFNNPNSIDILLGADVLFVGFRHDTKTRTGNYPVLQDTDLGWIISGKIHLAASEGVPLFEVTPT